MIEVIFKIFLTDYIDFHGFITKKIQKQLLIEHNSNWHRQLTQQPDKWFSRKPVKFA
jgi:hypothetical protein